MPRTNTEYKIAMGSFSDDTAEPLEQPIMQIDDEGMLELRLSTGPGTEDVDYYVRFDIPQLVRAIHSLKSEEPS